MTPPVVVRRARADDLPWIADLVARSFDPSLLPFLVAAQDGIVEWWRLQLEHAPVMEGAPEFLVAEDPDGSRLGYADLKLVDPREAFLSYVAITPEARGRGVAARLVAAYVGDHPDVTGMGLDVFAGNTSARRLYDRLGFVEQSRTSWWTGPLPLGDEPSARVQVADLHAVVARHRTYGFTDLVAAGEDGPVRVGVLGRRTLRCFDPSGAVPADVLATVRAVFPELGQLLVVRPADAGPQDHGPLLHLTDSLRMRHARAPELWRAP